MPGHYRLERHWRDEQYAVRQVRLRIDRYKADRTPQKEHPTYGCNEGRDAQPARDKPVDQANQDRDREPDRQCNRQWKRQFTYRQCDDKGDQGKGTCNRYVKLQSDIEE